MHRTRRLAVAALVAGGLLMAAAPASHAVVDPLMIPECLAGAATDLTALVDPSAPGVPSEVPAVHCLAP
ncbi:hypothetical protein [Nonomuraea sp. LPB2021202275-12-8]|uniref:hypothetical protein n=1 Tax=Nonomuraea sp. LPB2021202275-12-8 TaxID=3120159 RepID=UPI00300D1896